MKLDLRMSKWIALVVITALPSWVARCEAEELNVFAAVSLTDALRQIAADYEKQGSDRIVFNFGASNILTRQIQDGAPADVFFSADEAKMDALEKKRLLLPGSRRSLLSNTLAIVVSADRGVAIRSALDLSRPEVSRIAIAEPQSVPAGIYAKQYLQKVGVWKLLLDKLVPVENVRSALAAVESGNVEAGIVYKTDASISKRVRIAFEVPASEGPRISYPVAVIAETKRPQAARTFASYLESEPALQVFQRFGFVVIAPGP